MGRRLLIAGGTSGIGLATAKLCQTHGAKIYLLGRNKDKLRSALLSVRGANGMVCDVRDPLACDNAIADGEKKLGGFDTLVFSSGVGNVEEIDKLTLEDFKEIIDVNLLGAFNLCKKTLPFLLKSSRPQIILLGSRAGRYAFKGGTGYCAAKFGIQGFAESLFLDLQEKGILVTLVAPGTVDTGFAGLKSESWQLKPEDIADVICDCLMTDSRANINWVEVRPTKKSF